MQDWRASGQSATEYAAERDLSLSSLLKWSAQTKVQTQWSESEGSQSLDDSRTTQALVPVRVVGSIEKHDEPCDSRIEVALSNGRSVRVFGNSVCSETLALVLQAAEGGSAC